MPMFGLLIIDKPAGWTSRDVVNHVQRMVGSGGRRRSTTKVGHAGTLDPLATGVLVVCVGSATRLVKYVQRMPKRYTATFVLGRQSDTEDTDGDVMLLEDSPQPTLEEIIVASRAFVGQIEQIPPRFSAIKIGGRRAYAMARAGEPVELKPRTVRIDAIEIKAFEYPRLELDVTCGGGTYIRALGRDLASSLGTMAVMSCLRRTAVGRFLAEDALPLDSLLAGTLDEYLRPPSEAVVDLPIRVVSSDEAKRLANGLPILHHHRMDRWSPSSEMAEWTAVDRSGQLVALLSLRDGRQLWPARNFVAN